jgi:general secretion pathway protein N
VRFDSAGPRTWLLAATAGWAMLTLLLALLGMGGRIAPLPADTALLRPLSALPRSAPERLGPLGQYAEIASRPLFADDRRPHPFSLQPAGDEQVKTFDYVLTSVMITPAFKMAIIQAPDNRTAPLRIKLGEGHEALPNWQLQSLDARSAVFVGPEGERRLDLRVFNGVGGEPPTATTRPTRDQRPVGQPVQPPPPAVVTDADEMPVTPPAEPATPPARAPSPAPVTTPAPMTEQAQMDAIRKRIEQRRAQLRQEALLEQQKQQQQKPPVR